MPVWSSFWMDVVGCAETGWTPNGICEQILQENLSNSSIAERSHAYYSDNDIIVAPCRAAAAMSEWSTDDGSCDLYRYSIATRGGLRGPSITRSRLCIPTFHRLQSAVPAKLYRTRIRKWSTASTMVFGWTWNEKEKTPRRICPLHIIFTIITLQNNRPLLCQNSILRIHPQTNEYKNLVCRKEWKRLCYVSMFVN